MIALRCGLSEIQMSVQYQTAESSQLTCSGREYQVRVSAFAGSDLFLVGMLLKEFVQLNVLVDALNLSDDWFWWNIFVREMDPVSHMVSNPFESN